jgi:hypothetical protein
MNITPVDWAELARSLGTLGSNGQEHGSSAIASQAIEIIIGTANLRAAVDHYVALKPGAELARFVLWQFHPWSAMERCYEIYQTSDDPDARCTAVELLRVVADRRALQWIPGFLEDPDKGVQCWGAGVVDQLLFSRLVHRDECEELLSLMANHANEQVRQTHAFVQEYLASRGE